MFWFFFEFLYKWVEVDDLGNKLVENTQMIVYTYCRTC